MMQHGILRTVREAGQAFVLTANGLEPGVKGCVDGGQTVFPARLFHSRQTVTEEPVDDRKLGLIEHRHVSLTAPAPEGLHDRLRRMAGIRTQTAESRRA
jgi:hypothetical protein